MRPHARRKDAKNTDFNHRFHRLHRFINRGWTLMDANLCGKWGFTGGKYGIIMGGTIEKHIRREWAGRPADGFG